jgi:hypothetical protein
MKHTIASLTKNFRTFTAPANKRINRWNNGTITASIAVRLSNFGVPTLVQAKIKKANGIIAINNDENKTGISYLV